MPCDNIVIWSAIPGGSRFCASASGTNEDFGAGARIVGADGSDTQFFRADLVPGPAHRSLTIQQYAARLTMTPGATAPVVTMNAWVEDAAGTRIHECTWTATGAFKVQRVTMILVPAAV
jgi:hypothetical protein